MQIWGTSSHRQLKPNLNLLVIGGERELATFLRYGPTSEHSAIRTVLLSKNQVLCSTPSQDCMTARHVQRTHGLALADLCGELCSPSPPGPGYARENHCCSPTFSTSPDQLLPCLPFLCLTFRNLRRRYEPFCTSAFTQRFQVVVIINSLERIENVNCV